MLVPCVLPAWGPAHCLVRGGLEPKCCSSGQWRRGGRVCVELCLAVGRGGSPFGTAGAGAAAGFGRGRLLGAAAATDGPRHSDDERTPPDRRKLQGREKRSSLPAIKLAFALCECWAP